MYVKCKNTKHNSHYKCECRQIRVYGVLKSKFFSWNLDGSQTSGTAYVKQFGNRRQPTRGARKTITMRKKADSISENKS